MLEMYRLKTKHFFNSPLWYLTIAAVIIAIIHAIAYYAKLEIPFWLTLLLCMFGALWVVWMLGLLNNPSLWVGLGVIALALFTLWNFRWIALLFQQPQILPIMMAIVGLVMADFIVTYWQLLIKQSAVTKRSVR